MKWNKDLLPYIGFLPREMEKDYIMIYNGGGCHSYIGRIGGQQPFSLSTSGCLTEGIILHEMSHTVGIIHEHNRPDRDNYIKILLQNIPEGENIFYVEYFFGKALDLPLTSSSEPKVENLQPDHRMCF
ncbi:Astacin [Araneus ventricosus]|uniref:Metalloendopeptidase n=1 Tax=Araneus ventricosus TaxID=182803 RepID=A0A4Y2U9A5_ARAVE|nr:Astacin [Araneus ventricosus]GBO08641.1 Astacin [Araneus ventricosus]